MRAEGPTSHGGHTTQRQPRGSYVAGILGASDLNVSCIGLGCMGMSYAYGATDDAESLRVLHRYIELGGNFLDTAEVYGPYDNELLLGRLLREVPRDRVVVATKFGFRIDPNTRAISGVDSSPANIRKVCDESLRRLGIDTIDLFDQHRVDPQVPIDLADDDWRHTNPRFQGPAIEKNLQLATHVKRLAGRKGCTSAQLALALGARPGH